MPHGRLRYDCTFIVVLFTFSKCRFPENAVLLRIKRQKSPYIVHNLIPIKTNAERVSSDRGPFNLVIEEEQTQQNYTRDTIQILNQS